jgi:hypothetical protein
LLGHALTAPVHPLSFSPFVLPDYFKRQKGKKEINENCREEKQVKNGISAFRLKTGRTSG